MTKNMTAATTMLRINADADASIGLTTTADDASRRFSRAAAIRAQTAPATREGNGASPVFRKERAPYSKTTMMELSPAERLDALYADGMWYDSSKATALTKTSAEEYASWLEKGLDSGKITASTSGAVTYRFDYDSVMEWHTQHGVKAGSQIFTFVFPPRLWDGMTEVEGFLDAPLQEVATVSFDCGEDDAKRVAEVARSVGVVRASERPGTYRLYCGSASYGRSIVAHVLGGGEESPRIRPSIMYRRETCDFPTPFYSGVFLFYRKFAHSLIGPMREMLRIFAPGDELDGLVMQWVNRALERFNEAVSVPFSGYLDNVLHRWPYDIAEKQLGRELSDFQKRKAVAIKEAQAECGDRTKRIRSRELAERMGITQQKFHELEDRHRSWLATKNAGSLTFAESADEKRSIGAVGASPGPGEDEELVMGYRMGLAAVRAAVETGAFADLDSVILGLDLRGDGDFEQIAKSLSQDFRGSFAEHMASLTRIVVA